MLNRDTIFLSMLLLSAGLGLLACAEATPDSQSEPAPSIASEPTAASAWTRLPTPTDLPTDRPLRAGFLIVDGVFNTELTAPYDVLEHTDYHGDASGGIEVFTVSPDGKIVTTYEGIRIQPHYSFSDAPSIDILIVPSADHSRDTDRENTELIAWVRETGLQARYVMSLCWGAFILAEAGLLEDVSSTTFPRDFDLYTETFPTLDLRRDVSFVHDGKALTSQGAIRSFELAMYFVDHLYGEKVAQGIGSGLLIEWPPASGTVPALIVEH